MTITWTRLGFLAFMIPLVFWAIAAIGWGNSNFSAFRVAFVLSAIAVWILGKKLNAESESDGDEASHKAFGFPMQWSGLVLSLAAFLLTMA